MSIEKVLNVQKREGLKKGYNRRLRTKNMIPGVFYTAKGDNVAVEMPALPLDKMYSEMGKTTVFTLEIDDNGTKTTHPVMIWEAKRHPYKNEFVHIDFYGVDLEKAVKVQVGIEFTGTSKGVKMGGKLETYRERVFLVGKPQDLPKKIVIDVTDMGLNSSIRVADLELPEGVKASYDQNFAIVSVISKVKEEGENEGD